MAEEGDGDDLISKILQEDTASKIDNLNSNNYTVDSLLNDNNNYLNSILGESSTENKEDNNNKKEKEEENKIKIEEKGKKLEEEKSKNEEKKQENEDIKEKIEDLIEDKKDNNDEYEGKKEDDKSKENLENKNNEEKQQRDIENIINSENKEIPIDILNNNKENEKMNIKEEEKKENIDNVEKQKISDINENKENQEINADKIEITKEELKKEETAQNSKNEEIKEESNKLEEILNQDMNKDADLLKQLEEEIKIESEKALKEKESINKPSYQINEEKTDYLSFGNSVNLDEAIDLILNEPGFSTSENQKQIEEIKNKTEKEIENEIKNTAEKDEEIKRDIEKMLEEEKTKKKKEEELKKKKEQEQERLENFYPPFKNPLDFVQYLEVDRIIGQISNEMKNFSLQNHRKQDNKYDVSQIRTLSRISKTLFDLKVNIDFINSKKNNLIVCTSEGDFLFFSIINEKLIKRINPKKIKANSVICLDITDDFCEMIVGYQDGTIALFNVASEEVKYTNNKLHKDSSIIELKIYKKEKSDLSFISTSSNGEVYFNTLKMLGFSSIFWRLNSTKINLNNISPIFMVKFIQFSMENQRLYSNLTKLKRYVILGSLESIFIYCVEPIQPIFEIKKPTFIKEPVVPDASIGIGRPPDVYMRFVKKDEKNHLLLIISWGKIIYFYQMPIIDGNSIENYKELGYYINLFNILRIGFMNNSVVYCLDKSFAIKVLDSSKINPGKITLEKGQPIIPKKNYLAEIEKSRLVSASISSQNKIYELRNNTLVDTYLYSIVENEDSISSVVVLGGSQIYLVNLVDWKFFLEDLQREKDFMNLFSVGIEIFKGKMMCFSNIPEEKLKKKKVGDTLKQFVNQYVILYTGDKKTNEFLLEGNEDIELIGNCIKVAIEFCIEIESFDYLVTNIRNALESKDYGELFLNKLQPFILCDKIKNINLSSDIIINLIELYNKIGKLDILSQMLLHININSIDTEDIRKKLEEMNLITPLIYLYMNGQKEDYFAPLEKMFDYFYSRAISNKMLINEKTGIIDYSSALSNKMVNEKDVRKCKEYNGHRILWYIRWCLTGKKFPDSLKKMDKNLFENLVPKITYWLLSPKVIDEFLRFDSKNYFMIHKNIFSIEDLRKKLVNAAKDIKYSIQIKGILSSSDVKIDNIEPGSLIKYMIDWCKKKNNIIIDFYLYDFIIGILNTDIIIEKEFKKAAICFILKNYELMVKDKNNQEINIMNNNLIKMIDKEKNFNEDDFKGILESIQDNNFNDLKLFLYDKLDDFKQYLVLYLSKKININEKETKIFNWIREKLSIFKEGSNKYDDLIKTIEEHTLDLAFLSINKFFELAKDIYSQSFRLVVERLKEDKETQLTFIEYFIKYIISTYENNENNVTKDEMLDIKYILDRHICLLVDLNKHDQIIPALQSCSFYPLDVCLTYFEKANIYEPCLYLYLKEGAFDKAFNMSITKLDDCLDNIINCINEQKDYQSILDDFYKYLKDLKSICENNNMHLEDLWFKVLNKLYEYEGKVGELVRNSIFNINKKNNSEILEQIISKEIKELMEKMCSFVSITQIMNFVSEHNQNAGFKDFRDLLTKMLTSYSNFTNILYSARKLLTNSILEDEHYFQELNLKGELLNVKKCDLCKQPFKELQNKKELLMVFNCNHTFHKDCLIKNKSRFDKNLVCPLCSELEFDDEKDKGNSLINKNNFIMDEEKEKNNFHVKVGASARKTLQKLEKYDDRSLEKHVLMINNSITVLNDKYRKEYK